jgi:hypothetical protein
LVNLFRIASNISTQLIEIERSNAMNSMVYTCRQYRLLIAGSRHASSEMLHTAYQAVARAKANGWMVLVGDNPQGIDAAVVNACDTLQVNVMVFGVAARPRKGSKQSDTYWRVDTQFQSDDDDEYVPASAYIERDRYMIDLCDRAFFIHNGYSRGTKVAYDYAISIAKPADIWIFTAKDTKSQPQSDTPPSEPPATVELVIDVTECSELHHFEGSFGLRALDENGKTRCEARQTIQIEANHSDEARLHTIIAGLERLTLRLTSNSANYCLRIYQTSREVDGWLAHGWKRGVPEVQRLTTRIDTLLRAFPKSTFVREPQAQLQSRLSKIWKGGDVHAR